VTKTSGVAASIAGALAIAAVSTLGDFIWATWIPRHRPIYGLTHGALLFCSVGLYLGFLGKKPAAGAIAGALIGGLAAGSFYVLAPFVGFSIMFALWFAVWIALGALNEKLNRRPGIIRAATTRGLLAAAAFGVAFYLISGIWFPFHPQGWDYLVHFAGWTAAYFVGFGALLVKRAGAGKGVPQWAIGRFIICVSVIVALAAVSSAQPAGDLKAREHITSAAADRYAAAGV
jgi:hypothetical protein